MQVAVCVSCVVLHCVQAVIGMHLHMDNEIDGSYIQNKVSLHTVKKNIRISVMESTDVHLHACYLLI